MTENNPTPWIVRAEGGVYMVIDANNDVVKGGLKKAEALAMLEGKTAPPIKAPDVGPPETAAATAEDTDAESPPPMMPSKGRRRGRSK